MSDASSSVHVVVLAAGKGTRMKTARPKVLHRLAGRTLLDWVLTLADTLTPLTTTVVIGHGAEPVQQALAGRKGVQFVVQEPQLGTGHAVLQTKDVLAGGKGTLVLLSGDVPLLRAATVARLLDHHRSKEAAATVLTAVVDRPFGYGRIVRNDGRILRIVEERDASPDSAASVKSTAASMPSTWRRSSTPSPRWGRAIRRASTICPISSASTAGAGCLSRLSCSKTPRRFAASTASASWPNWGPS